MMKKALPTLAAQSYAMGHDKRLHLLEARRGRGKSYSLTYWVRSAVFMGVPCWLNIAVDRYRLALHAYRAGRFRGFWDAQLWVHQNVRYVATWDDVLTAHDGIVILDEASRIFDSRNRNAVEQVVFEWTQLSRHLLLTLVFASQSMDWLDVRVRQLADTLWQVRKVSDKKRKDKHGNAPPVEFWLYGMDPWSAGLKSEVERQAVMDYKMRIPFLLDVATLYDTHQGIRLVSGRPSFDTVGAIFDHLVASGQIVPKPYVEAAIKGETVLHPFVRKLLELGQQQEAAQPAPPGAGVAAAAN